MLTIDLLDDDVAIGMQVHASKETFAGTGLAYFTALQIRQFGSDLEQLAVNSQNVAHIEGGLYENDKLILPLVQISCKCLGVGMRVRMLVRLAQDPYTGCMLEEVMQLSLPLEFAIHDVERAGIELQSLPNRVEIR